MPEEAEGKFLGVHYSFAGSFPATQGFVRPSSWSRSASGRVSTGLPLQIIIFIFSPSTTKVSHRDCRLTICPFLTGSIPDLSRIILLPVSEELSTRTSHVWVRKLFVSVC